MNAAELKQRAISNPDHICYEGREAFQGNVRAIFTGRKTCFSIYEHRASAAKVDEFLALFPTGYVNDPFFNIVAFINN